MPDKLTDKEIVKALEDLVKCNNSEIDCGSCSLSIFYPRCPEEIGELSLDLFNRLQAENERLKGHQKDGFFNLLGNCLVFSKTLKDYNDMRKGLKAEAYKEFAELLCNDWLKDEDENLCDVDIAKWIMDTCAELVGEDK